MMRHLKATLLIGLSTSLLAIGLSGMEAFEPFDRLLWRIAGAAPALPQPQTVVVHLVILLLAFGIAWTTTDIDPLSLRLVVAAGALIQVFGLAWVMNLHGLFFPPCAPALAIVLSLSFGILYTRSVPGERRRLLRHFFGGRISRGTFHALSDSVAPLPLAGAKVGASVVDCGILNHEELAEHLLPADYAALVNRFDSLCTNHLVTMGGCLESCDSRGVRVIFGAPLSDERHAVTACLSARELAQQLETMERECADKWGRPCHFGIGVESGEMTVAVFGPGASESFGAAGGLMAQAAKLCSANLACGTKILIGPRTFLLAGKEIVARPLDLLEGSPGQTFEEIYELKSL